MAMPYYENFINNVAKSPNDEYRTTNEAFVMSQWNNTTLLSTVQEETATGTFVFNPIQVWKNTVSEFAVRIIKNERDFRRLMFEDKNHEVGRGRFYNWENNYYIVYEPTNDEEPYSEVLVRRCNNIAKWIDADTGEIVEQPCVLEYDISSTNPKVDKDIIVANSSTTLVLQGNEKTHKLKRNQRFIFNGIPYKFIGYNNYMQDDYVSKDVPLLFIDIDFDAEKPTDDIENNIADRYQYNYAVKINENPTQQSKDFSSKLTANVTLNGKDTSENVVWSCNNNATIDSSGNYVLTGNDGDIAIFTATFGSFTDTISIQITSSAIDNSEIVIDPIISELNQQDSVTITAYLYKNGVKQTDAVSVVGSGAPISCYSINNSANNIFVLTNIKLSEIPLVLTFTSGNVSKSIIIKLTSLF